MFLCLFVTVESSEVDRDDQEEPEEDRDDQEQPEEDRDDQEQPEVNRDDREDSEVVNIDESTEADRTLTVRDDFGNEYTLIPKSSSTVRTQESSSCVVKQPSRTVLASQTLTNVLKHKRPLPVVPPPATVTRPPPTPTVTKTVTLSDVKRSHKQVTLRGKQRGQKRKASELDLIPLEDPLPHVRPSSNQPRHRSDVTENTGMPSYKCRFSGPGGPCGEVFSRTDQREVHYRADHQKFRFKCPYCQQEYRQERHLKDHLPTHTGKWRYNCDVCESYGCQRQTQLVAHKNAKHGEGKKFAKTDDSGAIFCGTCGKYCPTKKSVREHQRRIDCARYANFTCPVPTCRAGCYSLRGTSDHLKKQHPELDRKGQMKEIRRRIKGKQTKKNKNVEYCEIFVYI